MTRPELVHLNDVQIRRGSFTLRMPHWSVGAGEVVGIVGPNGAGKTTLIEMLAGLRRPSSGAVRVFGLDPWTHPVQVRSHLGYMSDDMPLFDMKIGMLLRTVSGYYETWDRELAASLMDQFKLDPRDKARKLSKGQGTRLRLVLAMAFRPKVLLLDEPAAGLDIAGRRALLQNILDVVHDESRSVIVSSHVLNDVERVADRLLVLDRGKMVAEGATSELVGEARTLEEAMLEWGAAG